jgi:hypothetical protein
MEEEEEEEEEEEVTWASIHLPGRAVPASHAPG